MTCSDSSIHFDKYLLKFQKKQKTFDKFKLKLLYLKCF